MEYRQEYHNGQRDVMETPTAADFPGLITDDLPSTESYPILAHPQATDNYDAIIQREFAPRPPTCCLYKSKYLVANPKHTSMFEIAFEPPAMAFNFTYLLWEASGDLTLTAVGCAFITVLVLAMTLSASYLHYILNKEAKQRPEYETLEDTEEDTYCLEPCLTKITACCSPVTRFHLFTTADTLYHANDQSAILIAGLNILFLMLELAAGIDTSFYIVLMANLLAFIAGAYFATPYGHRCHKAQQDDYTRKYLNEAARAPIPI